MLADALEDTGNVGAETRVANDRTRQTSGAVESESPRVQQVKMALAHDHGCQRSAGPLRTGMPATTLEPPHYEWDSAVPGRSDTPPNAIKFADVCRDTPQVRVGI